MFPRKGLSNHVTLLQAPAHIAVSPTTKIFKKSLNNVDLCFSRLPFHTLQYSAILFN